MHDQLEECLRLLLDLMRALVNLASVAGLASGPGGAYNATKHGVSA